VGALTTAVCSITKTARRRYFWAAWWTGEPVAAPFRKPDASHGGAKTPAEALAEAERTAGRSLSLIDPYWARAWKALVRGEPLPAQPVAKPRADDVDADRPRSAWEILGVSKGASPEELKRAFQRRALETHPDQGGDAAHFREVLRAFKRLSSRRRSDRGPRRESR
jgi:DnaJ domain